jgi:tetratricopeptide (TPR) repeat protein
MWRAKRAPVCSNFRRRGPPKIVNIPALVLVLFLALPVSAQQGSIASPDASPLPSAPSQAADSVFVGTRKLVQQGKSSEAIAELQRLGAENPKLRGLAHELGTTYYKAGDYLKAIGALKKATQEDPDDKESIQLLGLSNYLAGRPADAIPLLQRVQGWYPRANVDAAYILGVCYIQTNDYPRARVAFARMFDVPRDSAAAYLFTARVLLRQEFDPIAEEYAKKAIELDPKLPLAHFFLGELHLYKSRIPEAVADFQAELGLNPGHAGTYYKLADAYSRIQKFDDAERLLQRSIWLDATSTGPYILLGKVLEKKGEPELAMRALQHALSMDPNNTVAHHLLGQAYQDMGRTADAERERKLAQQLQDAPGKPD